MRSQGPLIIPQSLENVFSSEFNVCVNEGQLEVVLLLDPVLHFHTQIPFLLQGHLLVISVLHQANDKSQLDSLNIVCNQSLNGVLNGLPKERLEKINLQREKGLLELREDFLGVSAAELFFYKKPGFQEGCLQLLKGVSLEVFFNPHEAIHFI